MSKCSSKNIIKNLSGKYSQILLKKSAPDAFKTTEERLIQKIGEPTGDLIGNKIADKITSVSKKKPSKEFHNNDKIKEKDVEITTHKKRYISPGERQQIIDELGLVPKKYV